MKYNNVFLSCKSLFNLLKHKTDKIKNILLNLASFTLLSMLSFSAWADYTLNMDPGVSEISRRTYGLHMTIFWICVVIGVVVFGILIYSLIMHRKSKGHEAHDFHENTAVEVVWTLIPFIILIVMAIPATSVLKFIDDKSNSDVLIKITGYQWRWQYEYPEHDISYFSNLLTPQEQIDNKDAKDETYLKSVDNPLVLPINKKIRFLFTANDVIHSWWVPKLAIKKDAIPGFINESWVRIDVPGTYYGQCAELCGARHGYMPIVVEAKSEEDYEKWLAEQKAKPKANTEVHSMIPAEAMENTETKSEAPAANPTEAHDKAHTEAQENPNADTETTINGSQESTDANQTTIKSASDDSSPNPSTETKPETQNQATSLDEKL